MAASWQIDHVFLATAVPAVVERALTECGLSFTERRVHEGQGTANVCARFENAYLELLFGNNSLELQSPAVAALGLDERVRWAETGACPFGLCLRPTAAEPDLARLPFEIWNYSPAYLPAGAGIPIVTPPRQLHEPLVFLSPRSQPTKGGSVPETPHHRGKARTLTAVRVQCPAGSAEISAGIAWFIEQGVFAVSNGASYLLELEWDNGVERATQSFPGFPIELHW